ncbi:hypothetical protein FEM48_Zijuj05G0091800 [Ziziphus jujuba var. spinosa]|uniref:Uncharacterized protein n=1 Tax=Ziziphus jujuba var. spinosa TaxID=714518 RepID=A0A978VE34_ZIZJJ|nr:hypothetical protein FEM48_Zijuj05G0091800 [Ziziphus jujuba var. spinosa]
MAKVGTFQPNSVFESSLSVEQEEVEFDDEEEDENPTAELSYLDPETDLDSISEWELDFCSRPISDIRGKKVWELVVCNEYLSLQLTKYFPNNVINSVTLKDALVSISDYLGILLSDEICFLRCRPLYQERVTTLDERYESVYTRHPGVQKGSKALLALDNPFLMELPENLFGEKWAFVQLPLSDVKKEVSSLETKLVFGASLDLDLLGIEINENTLIPGLAVASSCAKPLAGQFAELDA